MVILVELSDHGDPIGSNSGIAMTDRDGQIRVIASGELNVDGGQKSLELWIIGDDGKPRSLGLMPASGRASMPIPGDLQMPAKPVLKTSGILQTRDSKHLIRPAWGFSPPGAKRLSARFGLNVGRS